MILHNYIRASISSDMICVTSFAQSWALFNFSFKLLNFSFILFNKLWQLISDETVMLMKAFLLVYIFWELFNVWIAVYVRAEQFIVFVCLITSFSVFIKSLCRFLQSLNCVSYCEEFQVLNQHIKSLYVSHLLYLTYSCQLRHCNQRLKISST